MPSEHPIFDAARDDDEDRVQRILDGGLLRKAARRALGIGSPARARGHMGATPLHDAATRGSLKAARRLLAAGADPRATRPGRHDTPLHFASTADVTRLLIDAGADPLARDWCGRTPLHWAAQHGHVEVVRLLLDRGADANDPAVADEAARQARVQGTEESLDARDSLDTPLHWAAREGHADVVRLLLSVGARADVANANGWTPLQFAAWQGRHAVIELLVAAGADLRRRDPFGSTPLHVAQLPETRELILARLGTPPVDEPTTRTPAELAAAVRRLIALPSGGLVSIANGALLHRWTIDRDRATVAAGVQLTHAAIHDVAATPDGATLAIATPGGVELRRASDLALLRSIVLGGELGPCADAVTFSPDGRRLAIADAGERVVVLDAGTGNRLGETSGGEQTWAIRFTPDAGRLVIARSYQGGVHVGLPRVDAGGRFVDRHGFDGDGRELNDGVDGDVPRDRRFADTLASLAVSPDGRDAIVFETSRHYRRSEIEGTGWLGNLACVDVESRRERWSVAIDRRATGDARSLVEAGHAMGYLGAVVYLDAERIAVAAIGGTVVLLASRDGVVSGRVAIAGTSADVLALAVDRTWLWAGCADGTVAAVAMR